MTQGNPHFYANPVNEDTGGKPMTGQEIGDARRMQYEHAQQHAAAHPAGNAPDVPQRDKRGVLTRAAMEAAIAAGGSVLVPAGPNKGLIATHVSHLPTATDLAEGDDVAEMQALESLRVAQQSIDAQMQSLARARANREKTGELAEKRGTPQSPAANPHAGPGDAGVGNFAARPGTDNPNDPGLKQTAPIGDPKFKSDGIDPRGRDANAKPLGVDDDPRNEGGGKSSTQHPTTPPAGNKGDGKGASHEGKGDGKNK